MRGHDKRMRRNSGSRSRFGHVAGAAAYVAERLEERVLLASFLVTKTGDSGPGSLRQAILDANAAPGADVIEFGGSKFTDVTPATISPGSALPTLQGELQIQGPGAKMLTVNTSFEVAPGALVTISGMSGFGADSEGALTISDCSAAQRLTNRHTGHMTLMRTTIADVFGAIINERNIASPNPDGSGHLTLINSTISGCDGSIDNGGVLTVINSTITGNNAFAGPFFGGAITMRFNTLGLIRNSIVAGNLGGDITNDLGQPPNQWDQFSLIGLVTTTNVVGGNPMLTPLQDNGGPTLTHAPLPGSPAINAGTNRFVGPDNSSDQRGLSRIRGGRIDIGAVESTGESLVVTTTADENDGTSDGVVGSGTSLREAIAYAAAHAGPDTITFGLPDGAQTIQLTSALPDLTDTLTITGSLSSRVTVSGGGIAGGFRVFTVASGSTVGISNIGVSNGFADALSGGGGIANAGGALTLSGVTVFDNKTAGVGGGILSFGTLTLTNSTVSGNFAALDGGGIAGNDTILVRNSTITDNRADSDANGSGTGGGMVVGGLGPAVVDNSIVADNRHGGGTRSDVVGSASGHFNLIGVNTGLTGISNGVDGNQVGTAVTPINPKLNNLADNGGPTLTHLPKSSSPVLNAGSAAFLSPGTINDQRGFGYLRASGAAVDIGAVEVQTPIASLVVTTEADENDGTSNPAAGAGTSLREAILYANAHPGHDAVTIAPGVDQIVLLSELPELATTLDITALPNGLGLDGKVIVRRSLAAPEFRILRIATNANVHLTGFLIENGAAVMGDAFDGNGSNIHNRGTLTLTDMVVHGGAPVIGARGGGIYNAGTLTVVDCWVRFGGTDFGGGGIYNDNTSTVISSAVTSGSARAGGGIFNAGRLTVSDGSSISGSASFDGGGGLFNDAFAIISGSTFSGSTLEGAGGGISNAAWLSVSDSTVSGGEAFVGGGIANSGTMLLTRSTVDGNSVSHDLAPEFAWGGGIYNGGRLIITSSTVSNNSTTGDGGGIYNDEDGELTVVRSTVSNNSATGNGGGIYNFDGRITVVGSTVSHNSATGDGGGIYNDFDGELTVASSTISNNSASGDGGGISHHPVGRLILLNCTIADNHADGAGGGISSTGFFARLTLRNTIVATNTASLVSGTGAGSNDVFGVVDVFPFGDGVSNNNLIGDGTGMTGITDGVNGNQIGTAATPIDPLLGPLANNGGPTETHALLDGSPGIDAGNNGSIPPDTADADGDGNTTEPAPFDQRGTGFARVVGGTVDIGAFEYVPPPLAPLAAEPLAAADFSVVAVGQDHAFDPEDLLAYLLDLPANELV